MDLKKLLFFTLLFFAVENAFGFDKDGHIAVERYAYQLLRAYPDGDRIFQFLIDHNILYGDGKTHTNFPDLSLERQFAQDKQMYHFMASVKAVLNADTLSGDEAKQQSVLLASVTDCYEIMYMLYRESMENGKGAKQAGRGVYVLMHIIADSYSPEHTTRDDETGELVTIKSWQLSRLCWPEEALAPLQNTPYLLLLHRGTKAVGDEAWRDSVNIKNTLLSPIGLKAAAALRDILIAIYKAMQPGADVDAFYNTFLTGHFTPKGGHAETSTFSIQGVPAHPKFNFADVYNGPRHKEEIFKFDRFPFLFFQPFFRPGLSKNAVGSYGAEAGFYISPHGTDQSNALLSRIPHALSISLTELSELRPVYSFEKALKLQAFYTLNLAAPVIKPLVEIKTGVSMMPWYKSLHLSVPLDVDLLWDIGWDFTAVGTAKKTVRLIIGYEYDNGVLSAVHSIHIKLGFNTWQSRFIIHQDNK